MARVGFEPRPCWSRARCFNHSTTLPTNNMMTLQACCSFDKIHKKDLVSPFLVLYYDVQNSFYSYFYLADTHFVNVT